MKIAIEARAVTAVGGVGVYVRELLHGMSQKTADAVFDVYYGTKTGPHIPGITEHVVPLANPILIPIWLEALLPRAMANTKPDVVHFTKAAVPKKRVAPTVVTIYDIIPILLPQTQSPLRRLYWPRTLRNAAERADHVITISQASKRDIMQQFRLSGDKITVTPLAANTRHFTPRPNRNIEAVRRQYGIPSPYILFVGRWDERKNIPALVRAFEQLHTDIPHTLVIAGKPEPTFQQTLRDVVGRSAASARVRLVQHVAYKDLPSLMSGADVFVWPSIYEGWGLPPLEALACGTPVVVSDGGSLPEAVGDAARIVPFSKGTPMYDRLMDAVFERNLTQAIRDTLENTGGLQDREARIQHAKSFSWDMLIEKTFGVYNMSRRS